MFFNTNQQPNSPSLGVIILIFYCLISAFSRVFISHLLQTTDVISFCYYTFTLGCIFFVTLNYKNNKMLLKKIKNNIRNICWLNVTTLGCWLFLTYPLKIIEPAIVSTITFGVGPIFSLLFAKRFYKNNMKTYLDYPIAIGLFINIIYMTHLSLANQIITPHIQIEHKLIAIFCCIIVGLSVVINAFQTKKLIDAGLSPFDILSCRFYLLILIAALITAYNHHDMLSHFYDKKILFSAIIFVIVPLYLIQIGQREVEPITVAFIMPFLPAFTYLFELNKKFNLNYHTAYAILAMLLLISLATYMRYKQESSIAKKELLMIN